MKKFTFFKTPLHWQILISLSLSVALSLLFIVTETQDSDLAHSCILVCDFFGKLFLNALNMIVVPIIVSSIICSMTSMGSHAHFGRMGLKSLAYYISSTLIAVLVGLGVANLLRPGQVNPELAQRMIRMSADNAAAVASIAQNSKISLMDIFVQMVPRNVFSAAADNGQILGVICFSLLFGFFASQLPKRYQGVQADLWQSFLRTIMMIADMIVLFAPLGAFALVTPKIIGTGLELMVPAARFLGCTVLALSIHLFAVLPAFLYFFAKVNPLEHFRAMMPALLTAFSTSSSIATLPIMMDCVEKNAGVSNRVASFTLPMGITMNMNGSALYECMVVIFIAQLYAVVDPSFCMTFVKQFTVVIMAALTSLGVAGIPSGSFVAIAVILSSLGLPLEYMGIVLVVDRILDMCRTTVNVFSDTVGAVVIARSEGETVYGSKGRSRPL